MLVPGWKVSGRGGGGSGKVPEGLVFYTQPDFVLAMRVRHRRSFFRKTACVSTKRLEIALQFSCCCR